MILKYEELFHIDTHYFIIYYFINLISLRTFSKRQEIRDNKNTRRKV